MQSIIRQVRRHQNKFETPDLSQIREQLIEFKRSHIKGGLMEIENSKTIVDIINRI